MKRDIIYYLIALVALATMLLCGCCPCKRVGVTANVNSADSTYTAHDQFVRIIIKDTLLLQPLTPSHDMNVTKAQFSELENRYCTSMASVDDEGYLHHTLDTKDSAMLPAREVTRDSVVRDTIIRYRDRVEARVEVQRVKVKPWWVKPLGAITAVLTVIVVWQNRKRILSIVSLWRI